MPRGIPKNRISQKQYDALAQKLEDTKAVGADMLTEINRLTQENASLKEELQGRGNGRSMVPFKDMTEIHPMTGPMVRLRIGQVTVEIAQDPA